MYVAHLGLNYVVDEIAESSMRQYGPSNSFVSDNPSLTGSDNPDMGPYQREVIYKDLGWSGVSPSAAHDLRFAYWPGHRLARFVMSDADLKRYLMTKTKAADSAAGKDFGAHRLYRLGNGRARAEVPDCSPGDEFAGWFGEGADTDFGSFISRLGWWPIHPDELKKYAAYIGIYKWDAGEGHRVAQHYLVLVDRRTKVVYVLSR